MSPLLRSRRVRGLTAVALLFLPSLLLETLIPAEGDPSFLIGLVCLLFGFTTTAWLANPLLLGSALLVLVRRARWAIVPAALAATLASTALSIERVPVNESGTQAAVVGYGLGFHLWMASLVAMLATAIWCSFEPRRRGATPA